MKEIGLTQGKVALVSDEDYEELNKHKWHAAKNYRTYYAQRTIRKEGGGQTTICMHKLLVGKGADHIDGDGLNNQRDNLRLATSQQNAFNRQSTREGTSTYKGVSWDRKGKKWRACIGQDGKIRHIGYFDDELKAATAYDDKARELFGEFAWLNFPTVRTPRQTASLVGYSLVVG